jgi:tetratricopeptide (TPR) repeat protein
MTDHVFISYSTADALDFARKLANKLVGGTPRTPVWFDKDDLKAGREWDIQIDEALKSCKLLLFVMTKDSTHDKSVCRQEWSRALSFKKIIVPLWVDNDIDVPFRLADRQRVDFRGDFDRGLAQLRDFLMWLDSPEGVLQGYKDRLLDAERDLQRASEADKPRIQADIKDLKEEIKRQEKIVANPKAAEEQTQKNIETGLERERKPELPLAGIQSTKFINPPPGIAPNYFQDRTVETKQVFDFLHDDAQRLMTIVGRGGVGKTAIICRLLKHLENSAIPEDLQKAFSGIQPLKVGGIVYLSESGSHRVNFTNIFYDLCKLLPKESAQAMDAVYKNPQASTESKMRHLLEHFTGERVVLLLDNFEPLVDAETFEIHDTELNEALLAFLNGTHTSVNIIITTRIAPKKLNLVQPGRQRPLDLDDGLESPYAENILREMDSDGRLGLKSASDKLLKQAKEKTRGFPKALEALFAILASDRYTTLDELLAMPTPVNVVEALVGEAFNRLDTNAQKVMQALAVYNRPVTPAAVDYLLAPHIPAMDSAPILQRLANMHFARKESGRFYLHPVDREFAFGLIPDSFTAESQSPQRKPLKDSALSASLRSNAFTQHDLTSRAADYFAQARKPRAEWKKLEDLSAQLAEFDLRCAAGDYDTAASVLTEFDGEYLLLWGHYRLMIDLHEKLQKKIKDLNLARISVGNLGQALMAIGKVAQAISNYENALEMAKEAKNRQAEETWLGNLGTAYYLLGNSSKAVEFYEQALTIDREIGDQRGEIADLGSLGNIHGMLGNSRKAIEYYEQAMSLARKIGDRQGENISLSNLGNAYTNLGDVHKAIEFFAQAMRIDCEIGDRRGESADLGNLGNQYLILGDSSKAIEYYEKSLLIKYEIGDRRGEAIHTENTGHALLNLEEYYSAYKKYQIAIQIADEISLPMVQQNARSGLAQAYLFQNDLVNARATIEAALGYDVPENNHNASALHGIIALRQGDEVTARGAFLRALGQADEILSKTAEYYDALDAKGLALCGLALCRSRLQRDDSPNADDLSRFKRDLQDAIETFRKARKIAPHAGVVKSVLRLFDELAKCDTEGILKDVREVIDVKPLVE